MSLVKHLKHLILTPSISRALPNSYSSVEYMILEAIVLILLNFSCFCFFTLSWLDFSLRLWYVLSEVHSFFTSCLFFGFLDWRLSILRLLSLKFSPIDIVELIECLDILCELLYRLLLLPSLLPFLTPDVGPQSPHLLRLHLLLHAIEVLLRVRLVIAIVDNRLAGLGGCEGRPSLALHFPAAAT